VLTTEKISVASHIIIWGADIPAGVQRLPTLAGYLWRVYGLPNLARDVWGVQGLPTLARDVWGVQGLHTLARDVWGVEGLYTLAGYLWGVQRLPNLARDVWAVQGLYTLAKDVWGYLPWLDVLYNKADKAFLLSPSPAWWGFLAWTVDWDCRGGLPARSAAYRLQNI